MTRFEQLKAHNVVDKDLTIDDFVDINYSHRIWERPDHLFSFTYCETPREEIIVHTRKHILEIIKLYYLQEVDNNA